MSLVVKDDPQPASRNQAATVAVLTDEYADYQKVIVDHIAAVMAEAGLGTLCIAGRELVSPSGEQPAYAVCNSTYSLVERFRPLGIICLSGNIGHRVDKAELATFLGQFNLPVVSLGIELEGIASVLVDDSDGMQLLMEHMLSDTSRQRFAFVRGIPSDAYSLEREDIFRSALEARGLEIDEALIVDGNYDAFEAYHAATALLNENTGVDAIVAANDVMALSVARAINARGLRIPEDIMVSGFDDTREATKNSPALTTVRQPIAELAGCGATLLLQQIHAKQEATTDTQLASVYSELVIRGSTVQGSAVESFRQKVDLQSILQWLDRSLSGLTVPPGIELGKISRCLVHTLQHGSNALDDCFEELLASPMASQDIHWWSNLCYQVEQQFDSSLIVAALARVRERIWSVSLDLEFEIRRVQTLRAGTQLEMSSCTRAEEILVVMGRWLQTAGTARCFLVRYVEPSSTPHEQAELIHVFRNNKNESAEYTSFASRSLLPASLQHELEDGLLVLSPVYAGNQHFGYMLMDPVGLDILSIDSTSHSIGNALRNQYLVKKLERQTDNLKNVNAELLSLANFDALTRLPNRLHFQQQLQSTCQSAGETGAEFALLFIDLDGFKLINDTLGHGTGDELLKCVAERIQGVVAHSGIDNGFIARLGGDEFTVIFGPLDPCVNIEILGQRLLDALARAYSLRDKLVNVSASIGCAIFPLDGKDPETLLKYADTAMYRAKARGKNCMAVFSPDMTADADSQLQLDQQMREALVNGEICMYFQPRIDLQSGSVCALEALMRWIVETPDGPEFKASPAEFIGVAEKTGFIGQLDTFALDESCRRAKQWERAGIPVPVAVNLSVVQLQRDNIVETIASILDKHQLAPGLLEIEISESAVMTDVELNVRKLGQVRKLGLKISVDDFGTGYSSLNYLKRLPVNNLKIDRSLIARIGGDNETESVDDAIVRSVIALGKSMELELIAEGVETETQLRMVKNLGCDQAQGYLFARPLPVDEINQLLTAQASKPPGSDKAA